MGKFSRIKLILKCNCLENEVDFVPRKIKEIMEDVKDKVPYLPIVAAVEKTTTNWADKEEVYFD